MAKGPTITDVTDVPNNASAINNNLNNLSDAFDNTLSLDGSTPNAMGTDLDMNSNDLLNVEQINGVDTSVLTDGVAALVDAAALSDTYYLGPYASDPTLDNNGDALIEGAMYFDTAADLMKVYDGTVWAAISVSTSDLLAKSNNLSDLTNIPDARTNLALGDMATQVPSAVAITGGVITGITDITIADGGTGSSTAADAFTALKQAATLTATGVVEQSTSAENVAGTDDTVFPSVAGVKEIVDTFAASAPIWVNFDGYAGVTINASSGISGIVRNGTGDYTISFTTAFADTFYAILGTTGGFRVNNNSLNFNIYGHNANGPTAKNTTDCRVVTADTNGSKIDSAEINVQFIR